MSRIAAPPIALTMGEPAGIGGEIACMAWLRRDGGVPPFFLIDSPDRVRALSAAAGCPVRVAEIASPEEAARAFAEALPVLPIAVAPPVVAGRPNPDHVPAVLEAIERAVSLVMQGRALAVVTNPVQKETLYARGFRYGGHTEYLATLVEEPATPIMMLACPGLRVVPVTVHRALRDALDHLTADAILAAGRITADALAADFAIARPILAVTGVNPHAGENGTLGREEIEIVGPAVARLRAEGIDARGPFPADTLFHAEARRGYDAALCMYHDQALIPLKTIDFLGGVNVTLGLPFVRTSPDHGTALDIAGTGRAGPDSLIAALRMAASMAAHRAERQGAARRARG